MLVFVVGTLMMVVIVIGVIMCLCVVGNVCWGDACGDVVGCDNDTVNA